MIKKIVQSCTPSNSWSKCNHTTMVIRVLGVNTLRTLATTPSSVPKQETETLFSRLIPVSDQKVSMVPLLDQWVDEGRNIELEELQKIIKQFRKFRRIKHALQISQWMSGKSFLDLSPGDVSVQLDLISKVHGVEQAEEYFKNIPDTSKNFQVYGALLNCYANAKLLEKAEAVMQKLRDWKYASTLSYNVMLKLYSRLGMHDKLDSLMQEMEEKCLGWDKFTYNTRLDAYAVSLDIEGMEKLLRKMESDPSVIMDWNAYAVAAKGYFHAGNKEKAVAMLKRSEQLVKVNSRKFAYELLMTMYANLGYKDEVYRIWNLYKNNEKFYNMGYLCIINSLAKMDDLDGAQTVYEEWEANRISFDHRVPNILVTSYCKKGLMDRAESVVCGLVDNGEKPNASTWTRMALGYCHDNQMEKAVEALTKSILINEPGFKPHLPTLTSCLKYLKEKGDFDTADQIKNSLAKQGLDYSDIYERLDENIEEEKPDFKDFDETESDRHILEEDKILKS